MNKEIFEQSMRQARQERLTSDEKTAIRQSILNFISRNPIQSSQNRKPGIFLAKLSFSYGVVMLLAIVLTAGGGLGLAAEKSLPGDTLYPIKVGVNEEVRGWLMASEKDKTNWEIQRVEKRLAEAEELASDGSLDVEAREKIEANFEAHAERVNQRIEKFEDKEDFQTATDVSSKFETSLKAHQMILNRLTVDSNEEIKKEIQPIEARVKSRADNIGKTRKRIELKGSKNLDR